MLNLSLNIVNSGLVAAILYTILSIAYLIVPFIVYYYKYKNDTTLIQKYLQVFPDADEAYAAYIRDKENLNTVEPYRNRSIFAIIYYLFVFYILSNFISLISIFIYLKVNGFTYDIIDPNSAIFSEDVYAHMESTLNLVLQIVIYSISIIGVLILMWKPFKEDIKRINGKTFAYGAMGLGIMYLGSLISNILYTLINLTEWQASSTNQEAIDSLFSASPVNLIILFIVIVIMAPILEELIFRKSIYKLFKNQYLALIVSSLAFGMLHVISPTLEAIINWINGEGSYLTVTTEFIYIIQYSLMGVGLGMAYIKSRKNICSSIFAHMINNLISYLFTLFMVLNPELLESLEEYAIIFIKFII